MSAAKRTLLAAVSLALVGSVIVVGSAGARSARAWDKTAPSAPANMHVVTSMPSAVMTAWSPSQDNVGVAGYIVYQEGRRAVVSSPGYTVTGLTCGDSTTISVAAFDQAGNRSARANLTAATAACTDTQAPTVPSGFAQAATTESQVVLTWAPSQDDVGVVRYDVYRDLTRVASPSVPNVTLGGLVCGTTYTYSIDAADAAGNRSLFGTAYVRTASCGDGQAPTAPAGLAVTGTTAASISVAWSPSSDDVGVAGYHVRRGGTLVTTTTKTTATLSGLTCGAATVIAVDAFDAAGNQSSASTTSATTDACATPAPPSGDTTAPSQPSGLAVSGNSSTSVSLRWAASSDDVGVSGYGVYLNGQPVSSVNQLAATVTGLTCATTYSFDVDAYDAAGNRSTRATISAASASCSAPAPPPPPADTTPPSKPVLTLGPLTQTSLELDWQAASDNVGVDHYNVWLGHSGGSDFAAVAQAPATQLSHVYQGLSCGTAYTVGLEAVDAAGNKSTLADATLGPVTTQACAAPPPAGDTTAPTQPANLALASATRTSVSLTWSASSDNVGVTGYRTYLNNVSGSTTSQPGATVSGLTCGTAYTFGVDAFDAAGNRSTRSSVTGSTAACADTQAPVAPANVVAGTRTATSIALSWSASSDNVGVTGYGLYRGGTQTGTTATTNGIFSGLTCNTNYTLAVDAYDAAGNRSTQTIVMVSTLACPDTTAPTVAATSPTNNATVSGTITAAATATDNVGVARVEFLRDGTVLGQDTTSPYSLSVDTTTVSNGSHTFGARAYDAAGNMGTAANVTVTVSNTTTPTPPATTGCAVSTANVPDGPDGKGGCWPGPSNTGPNAPESSMSAYTGPCTVTAANTVIDSKIVNCSPLNVGSAATGLVIKNSYVKGGVIQDSGSASFTIQDSVIDNAVSYPACSGGTCAAGLYACGDPNNATTQCGVGYRNFTILRTEIVNTNRAAYCESTCTIQDSYFHGTNLWPDKTNLAHASSVRAEQYLTLRHNSLGCDYQGPFPNGELGCSADMSGYPDFAPIRNNTIDSNLFLANNAGAGFCVYGGGTTGKPFSGDSSNATNIVFQNNVFQRGGNGKCGTYGAVTDFASGRTGNVWSGNTWDNGATVASG